MEHEDGLLSHELLHLFNIMQESTLQHCFIIDVDGTLDVAVGEFIIKSCIDDYYWMVSFLHQLSKRLTFNGIADGHNRVLEVEGWEESRSIIFLEKFLFNA